MSSFIFYFREGCHLCDDMRQELYPFIAKHKLNLTEIDIDRDADLVLRFDVKVPVLCLDEEEICHHFFDEDAIQPYLN